MIRSFYRRLHISSRVSYYLNTYEESLGIAENDRKVCLEIGAPSSRTLRNVAQCMHESTLLHFNDSNPRNEEILQYGCSAGNMDLKEEIGNFLTEKYKNPVDSEDLFINSGASQGFTSLIHNYFEMGDTLFVEDLTYWSILKHLHSTFQMNVVGVDIDKDGMNVDVMEKYLETKFEGRPVSERRPYRGAVYIIPVHHNPTGVCLSQERCRKLIKLARKYDLLVISDDVYNAMTYSSPDCNDTTMAKPPPRLIQYDNKSDEDYKESVVSISSFSKLLAPGLRLGWYEMPPKMLESFKSTFVTDSGSGWNPYTGGIIATGFRHGIVQAHIQDVCKLYWNRIKHLHEMVMSEVGDLGVKCTFPKGGIFMWITLPREFSADQLLELCKEEISFVPGSKCSKSGSYDHCLRIAIGFYEEDVIYPTVYNLCGMIKEFILRNSEEQRAQH